MKNRNIVLGIAVLMALSGCANGSQDGKANTLDVKVDRGNPAYLHQPIMLNADLPVQKLVITSGNDRHEVEVEIASTDMQRRIGLMNRKSMDEGKGMLFAFETQGLVRFWMKDTLFPLDIMFIDKDGYIQSIAKNALPCLSARDSDCPKISSVKTVKFVLEVNAGMADKWGVRVGDRATWI